METVARNLLVFGHYKLVLLFVYKKRLALPHLMNLACDNLAYKLLEFLRDCPSLKVKDF